MSAGLILPSRRSLLLGAGAAFITRPVLGVTASQKSAVANGAIYYNFNSGGKNLAAYWAGRAAQAAGTRNSLWMNFGDSSDVGAGAGTSGSNLRVNARNRSWMAQLSTLMNNAGVTSNISSQNGDGGNAGSITLPSYNPMISFDSSWVTTSGQVTLGGYSWSSATNGGTASFTPTNQVDTFVICNVNTGGNSMNININGGSTLATVGGSGSTVTFTTVTGSLGINTLNLVNQGTTTSYVVYVYAYNSAVKEISCRIAGWFAQTSTTLSVTSGQYNSLALLENSNMHGDLIFMEGGISNDGGANPIGLGTSLINQTKIINGLKSNTTLILNDYAQSANAQLSTGVIENVQTAYRNQFLELAYDFNLPFISFRNYFGQFNQNNFPVDGFHLSYAAQGKMANVAYAALQPGFSAP